MSTKVSEFKQKLTEELTREKEEFQARYDEEGDAVERDYEKMEAKEEIIELLIAEENKDAVEELINAFIEKLEAKLTDEDQSITRNRNNEHTKLSIDL